MCVMFSGKVAIFINRYKCMKNSWRTRNKYTIYFNILIKSLYLPPTSTQELIRLYLSCKTIKQNNHEDKTFTWSTTVISLYNYFF